MRLTAPSLILAALAALAGAAAADEPRVALYNWSDYIDEAVLDAFEAETGIAVTYDAYSEGEVAEARLMARGSGYDLAVVSSEMVGRLSAAGAIAPIERGRVPAAAGIDPRLLARVEQIAPASRGALPYLWGMTGLAHHPAQVLARIPDAPLDSWSLLFDPENAARLADCGIAVLNSPEETLAAALAWLGRDPASDRPEDIEAGLAAVAAIAPYVRGFGSEHFDMFRDEAVCLALTWNVELPEDESPYVFVAPREGAIIWFDMFVIPADAPHPEAAYRLLDHLLRPANSAACSSYGLAASPVTAARALVDPNVAEDPRIYPPAELVDALFGLRGLDAEGKRALDRMWRRARLGL